MEDAKFYWTLVVALVSGLWVVVTFMRDRQNQRVERTSAIVGRLIEGDRFSAEHPQIQQYLSRHAGEDEAFFHAPERLEEPEFFSAKTLAYSHLNMFDEILSISSRARGPLAFLIQPAGMIERADWEEYMREKMRHPLYRSIMKREGRIFGAALREFWIENMNMIDAVGADAFMW